MILDRAKHEELEKLIDDAARFAKKKQEHDDEDMANFDMAYRVLMRALGENKLGELMMARAAAKVEGVEKSCPEIMMFAKDRIHQIKHTRRFGWVDGVEPLARWKLVFVGQEKIFNENGDFERWSWGYKIEEISESDYSFEQHFGGPRSAHSPPNWPESPASPSEFASYWPDQLDPPVEAPVTRVRNIEDDCVVGACGLILATLLIGPCIGL